MLIFISGAAGVISSAVATAATTRVLRNREVLDIPNQRSSHVEPVVRGGGVGLAIGTLVGVVVVHADLHTSTWFALVLVSLCFGVIGFADDLSNRLSAITRLTLQFIVALGAAIVIWQSDTLPSPLVALVILLTTVWIVSFVNAFNFMDGINGISSAEAIVAGLAFFLIGRYTHHLELQSIAAPLVAGTIGFAPFNFPKARIFLGDVGSYFVGAWLGILVVIGLRESIPAEAMLAPVMIFIADTGTTLLRRIHRHESLLDAHRQHSYQRLVDLGFSHAKTTGIVFLLTTICSILGSISLFGSTSERVAADFGVAILVAGYVGLPELIEHRRHSSQPHRRGSAVTET